MKKLQEILDKEMCHKAGLKILEAGCGSCNHVQFGERAFIVGIDISEIQLQRNSSLDERIVGDIQYHDFHHSLFDVIICWDVLEHLPRPELALHRFASAVKKEGLIILKMPNPLSLKGLLTKYLPHSCHIWAYRYLQGKKNAGKNDTAPFKTYLKFSITPASIRKFAAGHELDVIYFHTGDVLNSNWFKRHKIAHTLYKLLKSAVRCVSFGKLNDSDFLIVLQKPAALAGS